MEQADLRRSRKPIDLRARRWDSMNLGKLSRQAMLSKLQKEGYDTTVYTFGPGTVFGDHSHSVNKKDAILSGRFLFRMGGEEVRWVVQLARGFSLQAIHYLHGGHEESQLASVQSQS